MPVRAQVYFDAGQTSGDAEVREFRGRELLSEPFDFQVHFEWPDANLNIEELVWGSATVQISDTDSGSQRFFHGVIEEAEYVDRDIEQSGERELHVFRLRLRPYFNGLRYRQNTRIFQQADQGINVPDIIRQAFTNAGLAADGIQWDLQGTYEPRLYTTQYRETDFNFVSRWLESEGIFYWFEHSDAGHTMHIADHSNVHTKVSDSGTLLLARQAGGVDTVSDLTWTTRVHQDAHTTRDWNWANPNEVQRGEKQDEESMGFERYEYPGGFRNHGEGGVRAQDRFAAQLVQRYELRGKTGCFGVTAGRWFALPNAKPNALVGNWVVLEAEHVFTKPSSRAAARGTSAAATGRYQISFRAMPLEFPFKPARTTPAPKVFGTESAVVTTPAGETIHTDEYGRIKVRFYWDRENPVDDTASTWVRVQQVNNSGSMILPRVGWEMTLKFLNGNPDEPVALQKILNDQTMPPYELPGNMSSGALQSSPLGESAGTNEIRMGDSRDNQEFYVHAQRDYNERAGNNRSETVIGKSTFQTGTDLMHDITGNEDETVLSNQSLTVNGAVTDDTGGNHSVTVSATETLGVTGNTSVTADGDRSDSIGSMVTVMANAIAEQTNATWNRTVTAAQMMLAKDGITDSTKGTKTETVIGAKIELCGQSKSENMTAGKVLTAGIIKEEIGGSINCNGTGALTFNAGGPIQIDVTKDFSFGGKTVSMKSASAKFAGGGCALTLTGGAISFGGKKLGVSGTAQVTLKGKVVFDKKKGKKGKKGKGKGKGAKGGGGGTGTKKAKNKSGKVSRPTVREQRLAAEPGNSPEQIAARKKVATHFYQTNGKKWDPALGKYRKMTNPEIAGHMGGIDFNQPVRSGPPPAIPSPLTQWQSAGSPRGSYFAPQGTSASQLGIGPNGPGGVPKTTADYNISPQTKYLQSTTGPITDTWSNPGTPQPATGGGTQYYVPNGSVQNHPQVKPV